MYEFRDIHEVSEGDILPSEALQINGDFIENLIPGYRTLNVSGREALSPELETLETGSRDGSTLKGKRYPARIITVRYQLIAESDEAFREAYNQLAAILNVEEAELIFNDELDKFFIGTPSAMSEVEPGRNAVVGEFEILCADPFKYSVVEYEVEAEPSTGSFLIDYNGTYEAYPTLEAEFYHNEDGVDNTEGFGDCGYVAFFNESERIIQLGDPKEEDAEVYPESQTLFNQKFNKETSWGNDAQANWSSNNGKVSNDDIVQGGNMVITAASHLVTVAPTTSGTLLTAKSQQAKPYINYNVTAKTTKRTAERINVEVTIKSSLTEKSNSGSVTIKSGAAISLKNTPVYYSSTSTKESFKKTGTYYIWDASIISGKIRITNTKSNVGKSGRVTGWVKTSDIGAVSTTNAIEKSAELTASIQFGSGDWYKAVLKKANATWGGNNSYTTKITVEVKGLDANTTLLEDIKFKVERTDENEEKSKVGILEEINCKDLEISTYTAPVPNTWYLMPQTYGTGSKWHGTSITRKLPADKTGEVGAKNFTLTYQQKMSIGNDSKATQEIGMFQALLISGSGDSRRIVAGINVLKNTDGKTATLRFYVNKKTVHTMQIDLSFNNKYFGNNTSKITTVKTSSITKTGSKVEFNIGGIKKTFRDSGLADVTVKEVTFLMAQYGTRSVLTCNGLYWAKFVKNNCDTFEDIPNKFSADDVVTADCRDGQIYLNQLPAPSLGAMGNDWEYFYLTPGLNQIGFSYSSWLAEEYAPTFRLRYREVFI